MERCYSKNALGYKCMKSFRFFNPEECGTCLCASTFFKAILEHHKLKEASKPPLGIKPKKLHRQDRMQALLDAMLRYTKTDKQIPMEWIEELNTINGRIY